MTTTIKPRPLAGIKANSPEGNALIFPLKHTEVFAKIAGNLARVEVRQQFENPLTQPLEAVYVFPLPDESAVDEMEIKIGDRLIKGNIKKREEAKQIYEQAKQQGRTAGLLEQERDNIFTQSLANIKPGEQIDVIIRYSESLKFEGGNYEFVFPMVVGPRFIPGNDIGGGDTDDVPDASRITPPVMPPETRSGHDINVIVEIDAGLPIKQIDCPSHRLNISFENTIIRAELSNTDTIPNKDLIIRYQVSGNTTESTLLKHTDERGTHFALYFIPAIEYKTDEIVPKDVVFLMDTSGSQMGKPLEQCQELMRRFINGLNPEDTFTIIDFANVTTCLSSHPLKNTAAHRQKALNYINQLTANGGTYLLAGIQEVFNFPREKEGRLRSIVLLTDGYIGNEDQVLAEVQHKLQKGNGSTPLTNHRLYSFGVGSSVNRYLLNRIAEVGRGIATIVRYDEDPEPIAEKFFRQINNPVLTNIEIKGLGKDNSAVIYPSIAPDLFAQQPLVLFGRIDANESLTLSIQGTTGKGTTYEKFFNLDEIKEQNNPAIAQLWGRAKIKDLTNQMYQYETKSGVDAVTETALTYQLLSKYTAFVAVSEDVRVNPQGEKVTVNVPLEMPEGVSYEGIFSTVQETTSYSASQPKGAAMQMYAMPKTAARTQKGYRSRSAMEAMSPPPAAPPIYEEADLSSDYEFLSEEADLSSDYEILSDDKIDKSQAVSSPSLVDRVKGLFKQESKEKKTISQTHSPLKISEVTGLEDTEIESLTEHLKQIQFPSQITGTLRVEFQLQQGRIRQVIIDETRSTIQDRGIIDVIRRSLLKWTTIQGNNSHVSLTITLN